MKKLKIFGLLLLALLVLVSSFLIYGIYLNPKSPRDTVTLNKEELEFINQLAFELSNKRNLDGRYLIRNSGTEPLLRVLVEASNNEEMESFLEELLNKINGYIDLI